MKDEEKRTIERRIHYFLKPIASSSNSNIASAEYANPSEEHQHVIDGSSNLVHAK
jgi:hypothetical protein